MKTFIWVAVTFVAGDLLIHALVRGHLITLMTGDFFVFSGACLLALMVVVSYMERMNARINAYVRVAEEELRRYTIKYDPDYQWSPSDFYTGDR